MPGNCQLCEDAALSASASADDSAGAAGDDVGDDVAEDAPSRTAAGSAVEASVDALTNGLSGCSLMGEIVSRQTGLRRLILYVRVVEIRVLLPCTQFAHEER